MSRKICSIFAGLALMFLVTAAAHATLINFDDIQGGNDINHLNLVSNQYAGLGVIFSDPAGPVGALIGDNIGLSGFSEPNVLFAWQHQADNSGDLRLDFSVGPRNISLITMLSSDYYLEALVYGSSGLLGTFDSAVEASYGAAIPLSFSTSQPIEYILLTSHPEGNPEYFGNFSIDNLSFDSSGGTTPEPQSFILLLSGIGIATASLRGRFNK